MQYYLFVNFIAYCVNVIFQIEGKYLLRMFSDF